MKNIKLKTLVLASIALSSTVAHADYTCNYTAPEPAQSFMLKVHALNMPESFSHDSAKSVTVYKSSTELVALTGNVTSHSTRIGAYYNFELVDETQNSAKLSINDYVRPFQPPKNCGRGDCPEPDIFQEYGATLKYKDINYVLKCIKY